MNGWADTLGSVLAILALAGTLMVGLHVHPAAEGDERTHHPNGGCPQHPPEPSEHSTPTETEKCALCLAQKSRDSQFVLPPVALLGIVEDTSRAPRPAPAEEPLRPATWFADEQTSPRAPPTL